MEAFASAVDFEVFRPELDRVLAYSDGAKGGRPPLDPVMMFKVLVSAFAVFHELLDVFRGRGSAEWLIGEKPVS